jgi:hypothetical protein
MPSLSTKEQSAIFHKGIVAYVQTTDMLACQDILDDLINSLKSNFSKYRQRVPEARISTVFEVVVQQSGNKFQNSYTIP